MRKLILATLLCASQCPACSTVSVVGVVGPNFQIQVVYAGKPVEGLQLFVGNRRAVTDKHGIATFDIIEGASVNILDSGQPGFDVEVRLNGAAVLRREWPTQPIVVRFISGRLYLPDYLSRAALSLDLLDGLTGGKIGSTVTNDRGEFAFPNTKSGFYFLRLNPTGPKDWNGNPVHGLISVILDPAATATHMALDLGWSDCYYLTYSDRVSSDR